MLENYIITFGAISIVGLLVMVLGLKAPGHWKRTLETIGAIAFHVGVFGILYHKVELTLFISIVSLVLALFILIDPLKLALYLPSRPYRIVGFLLLLTSIAFSMMFFTNFPAWLWLIPLLIYLLPYVIPSLKKRIKLVQFLAWLVVISYLALTTYALYSQAHEDKRFSFLISWFMPLEQDSTEENQIQKDQVVIPIEKENGQKAEEKKEAETIVPLPKNKPPLYQHKPRRRFTAIEDEERGPFFESLKRADQKYLQLKKDYNQLLQQYRKLKEENKKLKEKLGEDTESEQYL